jgi:hypothetical protein
MFACRQQEIHAERDRKLEAARKTAANSSAPGCLKKHSGPVFRQPNDRLNPFNAKSGNW